jgi:UDP-N-acetylglucosamine--N-acetylmuramyl-(pentapeptide) pyrophosphoryl-undecaprenol N-acetylglucosamine transferase
MASANTVTIRPVQQMHNLPGNMTASVDYRGESGETRLVRVAFAGGGSGGHLLPSIAVAEYLTVSEPSCQLLFLISERTVDQTVLQGQLTKFCSAHAVSLPGYSGSDIIRRPWRFFPALLRAVFRALRELRQLRPQVILGTGGFVSVPGILAAWLLKIPIVLLEPNHVPGRATRLLSRLARVTCQGLPISDEFRAAVRSVIVHTGVPVRAEITAVEQQSIRNSGSVSEISRLLPRKDTGHSPVLVVLGGSQGGHRLNALVLEVMRNSDAVPVDWRIFHQAGSSDLEQVRAGYESCGRSAVTAHFFSDPFSLLREATLVVSRAGATTLAELACLGTPAILIPLSGAADDHQRQNACLLADMGAAVVVDETADDAAEQLGQLFARFAKDEILRKQMSEKLRAAACPEASHYLTGVLRSVAVKVV